MRRKTLIGATAVAAAAALSATALGQKPSDSGVSLKAQPTIVTFGQSVTLSGKVNGGGGVTVDVQRDPHPFGDGFATQRTVIASNNGNYSTTVLPTAHTHYRAVTRTTPERASTTVLVRVRFKVGMRASTLFPRRGSLVRFSGSVRPRPTAGQRAIVQKRTPSGRWVTVTRATLRAAGDRATYSARVRVRVHGYYRVKVAGDAAHSTGYSRERTITVR